MKIERVNDNQIRCTLNRADLEERQLSLKELAYGTDKARMLFREMMQRAMEEVNFSAENMPLVIEAIPLMGEGIMIIVTKVSDPEELDTRFARFAPSLLSGAESMGSSGSRPRISAEDVLKTIGRILGNDDSDNDKKQSEDSRQEDADTDIMRVFTFRSIDDLCAAAGTMQPFYHGASSLYRRPDSGTYYLVTHKAGNSVEDFNRICNILTEYGTQARQNTASEGYYREHFDSLIADTALQTLASL